MFILKFLFLPMIFLVVSVCYADTYKLILNPVTGKLDEVTVVAPNITPGPTYTGFTFDGTNYCLYVNGTQKVCYSQALAVNYLLNEDASFFRNEDGSKLVLEK